MYRFEMGVCNAIYRLGHETFFFSQKKNLKVDCFLRSISLDLHPSVKLDQISVLIELVRKVGCYMLLRRTRQMLGNVAELFIRPIFCTSLNATVKSLSFQTKFVLQPWSASKYFWLQEFLMLSMQIGYRYLQTICATVCTSPPPGTPRFRSPLW